MISNNGNGHKIELRCKCCGKLQGEFDPQQGILIWRCEKPFKHQVDFNGVVKDVWYKCHTFNAIPLKQPQLVIGNRVLTTFGTALN